MGGQLTIVDTVQWRTMDNSGQWTMVDNEYCWSMNNGGQ